MVDTHAHINLAEFDADLDDVVARALRAGVSKILCVGTTFGSSQRAIDIARQFPGVVYASVGIHPNHAGESSEEDLTGVEHLARMPEVVAIGETGLDFYRQYTPQDIQHDFFRAHIGLSKELNKPLVVHCRQSEKELLDCLQSSSPPVRGIRHCFSGSAQIARQYLELGMHISFAANVARPGHRKLKAAAGAVPAHRLLIETDSPYIVPTGMGAVRNEPAFLPHTLKALSEIRRTEVASLAEQTARNAVELLSLD